MDIKRGDRSIYDFLSVFGDPNSKMGVELMLAKVMTLRPVPGLDHRTDSHDVRSPTLSVPAIILLRRNQ